MKPDELELWAAVEVGEFPRDAALRLNMPRNRMLALCRKWSLKGKYEYGVALDLGWKVEA